MNFSDYYFCMDITRQTSSGTINDVNYYRIRLAAADCPLRARDFKSVDSAAFLTIRQLIH
jgi:hypothetical protein